MTTPEELARKCAEIMPLHWVRQQNLVDVMLKELPLEELLEVARAAQKLIDAPITDYQHLARALHQLQQKGIELT